MKKLIWILVACMCAQIEARNIYSLYTDKKGKKVGDLITVVIIENAKATKNSSTTTDHRNSMSSNFGDPTGIFSKIPGWERFMEFKAGTENKFAGEGEVQREGEFTATLSVRITEVLENGNLMIKGNKSVTLNEETETIELVGVIRPEDISSANMVYSNKIADATIKYSGDGTVSSAQQPGWITRFFNWLF